VLRRLRSSKRRHRLRVGTRLTRRISHRSSSSSSSRRHLRVSKVWLVEIRATSTDR
jgi:hypothetical protein